MQHPETLLLAPLMLADFVLMRLGARRIVRPATIRLRSGMPLHPLWRRSIATTHWPIAYGAYLVAIGAVFVLACRDVASDDPLLATLVGFLAGFYGTLIGLHVLGFVLRSMLNTRRRELEGTLIVDDEITIVVSSAIVLVALVPLALLALIAQQPETTGATLGAVALLVVHRLWLTHQRRRGEREAVSVTLDATGPVPEIP